MQQLAREQIVTVFMTTQVDEVRLIDDPPLLRTEITSDALRQAVEGTVKLGAKHWDVYKDVVQLSFLWQGRAYHFMLCNDETRDSVVLEDSPERRTYVFTDEEDMMAAVVCLIRDMYGISPCGRVMHPVLMTGWRMSGDIWPTIVNRAIKYRLRLPQEMLVAPDVRWPGGHYIGDLSNIYMQGGTGQRSLPGLADTLRFWGYWSEDHRPLPEDIAEAVCSNPEETAAAVELYLRDMYEMLCAYMGVDTSINTNPLAGVPVP